MGAMADVSRKGHSPDSWFTNILEGWCGLSWGLSLDARCLGRGPQRDRGEGLEVERNPGI